jgi:hypothetical protein
MKYFNDTGPCNETKHYTVEVSTRLRGVERMVDKAHYFVVHAVRQCGKTTYLHDLRDRFNAEGRHYVLYCSLASLRNMDDSRDGIPEIVRKIKEAFNLSTLPFKTEFAKNSRYEMSVNLLNRELTLFCGIIDKPLVILFDDVDCLSDDTLITFLRQLRDGFNSRYVVSFVHSIALVGTRNIRDFKSRIRPYRESVGNSSPFNIITRTFTMQNFTVEEIAAMFRSHTVETGRKIERAAVERIYSLTLGHPWSVNAIARATAEKTATLERSKPITVEHVDEALQTTVMRRDTYAYALLERLKEERVRKIVEPMIVGGTVPADKLSDDYRYAVDFGLIRNDEGVTAPSNPVCGELIARALSSGYRDDIAVMRGECRLPRYVRDGRIDVDFMMRDFQQFRRETGATWKERFHYREAAPYLMLTAFLHHVTDGSGRIRSKMATGTGRIDMYLVHEGQKYPLEIKIRHNAATIAEGLEQTACLIDACGCNEGWLAVFDRRPKVKWEDKLFLRKETVNGKTVTVVGL